MVGTISFMGNSVLGTVGDAWKRHRRVVAPVFNADRYQRLWITSLALYKEIVEKEKWMESDVVTIPDVNLLTHKVTASVMLCKIKMMLNADST